MEDEAADPPRVVNEWFFFRRCELSSAHTYIWWILCGADADRVHNYRPYLWRFVERLSATEGTRSRVPHWSHSGLVVRAAVVL